MGRKRTYAKKDDKPISREELEEAIKNFQKKGGKITKFDSLNIEEERIIDKVLNSSSI